MLKGSIVALITPFDEDGSILWDKLDYLISWHIERETDAILVCGTTGESATLTHEEHKKIITFAVEKAQGKVPIVAGCGSNSTHEALELTQHAKDVGVNYALIITPYYNKPTQEGMYLHYKTIAESVDIPIIIYNVPSRTGINIFPQTVSRLYKDFSNIIGIKEASGSLDQITKLMTLVDKDFLLLSGSDELTLPILSVGGKGVISVVANILPYEMHELVSSFLEGDFEKAKEMQLYMYELIKALFMETNPIPVKTALEEMGMIKFSVRLPLCRMRDDNLVKFREVLKKYNLI